MRNDDSPVQLFFGATGIWTDVSCRFSNIDCDAERVATFLERL